MSAPLLLIDVGNTRIKWAIADDSGPIIPKGELPTSEATANLVEKLAAEFPKHNAVLSSVVPKLVPYFKESFGDRIHQVTADSPALGLLFNYPKPDELGVDRLVAAAAVREECVGPAIIVQCGTATAFSVLDGDGRFCGGVIAPGPHAQLAGLIQITAQLPVVKLILTGEAVGKSTDMAIRIGIMQSYLGGVKEILHNLCRLGKPPLTSIILTGGNAEFLTDRLNLPHTLRPLLVFEGLRIIGLRAFNDV